ncbi:MAG: FAD/FMN-containing dehydrogenase [Alphaproteobacteria bacterium]|jgi:FAD/FMN-containing dehydrogenase
MMHYFAKTLRPENILTLDHDKHPFLTEWRGRFSQDCLGIILPETTQQVSACIQIAQEHNIAIVPQGGNTGLVGGQMPKGKRPQVIMSTQKMTKIRDISPQDFALTCDAGVPLSTIQTIAHTHNRLFPLSLASEGSATIGGLIATNAGGTGVLKYGTMRDLVLGLEVVLPNGDIISDTHYLRKNNVGFDPKYLFIGSEGHHGIVTAASLKLFSQPASEITCFIGVHTPQNALDILAYLQQATGDNISEFELIPQIGLEFVLKHNDTVRNPLSQFYPWYCLVTATSGFDISILQNHLLQSLEMIFTKNLAADAVIAKNNTESQRLRTIRMLLSHSQKPEGASIKHDVSVPMRHIPKLIEQGIIAAQKIVPDIRPCPFGHAGDGNIHFNFSQPINMKPNIFMDYEAALNTAIFDIVHKLNGCFSAEHGIGSLRIGQLYQYREKSEMTLRNHIKKTLDPNYLFNPDKGFENL